MRACVLAGVAAALILAGIDVYIFLSRTDGMAAVSVSRLFFAIVFQAVGVVGIVSMTLPGQAPWRRFLEDTHKALPWIMAAGGVLFGLALAVGALHYSNCARWDFNRGVMCSE